MKTFPIIIQRGLLKKIPKILSREKIGNHYVIITDEHVKKKIGKELLENLRKAGLKSSLIALPAGETTKTWKTVQTVCEKMAEMGVKRDDCLIALGGGVVGDVGGFVASIYMRGIPLIHIPTTLLAMVDSSIGGKTGIDLHAGKNLVGTFYQPKMILTDPEVLKDLPARELRNGYAEIVKHSVIASRNLFTMVAKNIKKMNDTTFLEKIIRQNVKIKSRVVQRDMNESTTQRKPSRMVLNYGHTIGHAIEKLEQYRIAHGEAVAMGMVLENRIAMNKKMLPEKEAFLIKKVLTALGLPTKLPAHISLRNLEQAIKADKKVLGGKLYFALPRKIGKVEMVIL